VPRTLSVLLLAALPLTAQRGAGELRLTVTDASGAPIEAAVKLICRAAQYDSTFSTDTEGRSDIRNLPFCVYQLRVERSGFAGSNGLIEIRSEAPQEQRVTLAVAPIETSVVVSSGETLIDPHRTGTVYYIGAQALEQRSSAQPSRAVLDLVQSQPGWLLEAGGVLHPRGSEYQTQYVIDGIPITDNRSPAFAPSLEAEDVQSMNVLTANYPAEYGRKLGGVIEVQENRDARPGFHGMTTIGGGSFNTADGYTSAQWTRGKTTAALSAQAAHTDRYLDPPVEQNYTNQATSAGFQARLDDDITERDRLHLVAQWSRAGFLVPNERIQQAAGQRQDRASAETLGQFSYQRVLSPGLLLDVRTMGRDLSAELWSNSLSIPIAPTQQRGFREAYVKASLSGHQGRQDWKIGTEAVFSSIRETFGYVISDPSRFDADTPAAFAFRGDAKGREQSVFAQDLIRLGRLTLSAGLRFDHYRLLVNETAFSPRLGAAWYFPSAGLALRASYDRAFQTPAVENLLLAGSAAVLKLNDNAVGLAVPPSRGNFYEAGFAKNLFGKARLDANWFRRTVRNFADDDLLLNTGVSFPIAFSRAEIRGFEARVDVPEWGPISGYLSYSNQIGVAHLPVSGGLFLDDNAAALLRSTDRFPITQDQRNSVRARVRVQPAKRWWFAFAASYGSGLPVELNSDADLDELRAQYGSRILSRVNFARGRVRPSSSVDASLGVEMWKHEHASMRIQADMFNIADRLNVINFAGLFSGTALGQPRSFAIRSRITF
jgi:outer membrane cobalamin receptor